MTTGEHRRPDGEPRPTTPAERPRPWPWVRGNVRFLVFLVLGLWLSLGWASDHVSSGSTTDRTIAGVVLVVAALSVFSFLFRFTPQAWDPWWDQTAGRRAGAAVLRHLWWAGIGMGIVLVILGKLGVGPMA